MHTKLVAVTTFSHGKGRNGRFLRAPHRKGPFPPKPKATTGVNAALGCYYSIFLHFGNRVKNIKDEMERGKSIKLWKSSLKLFGK